MVFHWILSDSKSGLLAEIFYYYSFFTSAKADGFPLEFEWQQVSSSL